MTIHSTIGELDWTDAGTIVRHRHTWRRVNIPAGGGNTWNLERKLLNQWVVISEDLHGSEIDGYIEANTPIPQEVLAESLVDAIGEALGVNTAGGQFEEAQKRALDILKART